MWVCSFVILVGFMFMLDSRAYLMWFVLVCGSPPYFVRVRFGLRTVLSFDTCWLENVWVLYMIPTPSPHFIIG